MASRSGLGEKVNIIRASWDYPGWRVVGCAFLIFFLAFGAPITMPFVYPEVIMEFGWTLTQATLIYTYKSITGAVMALFFIGPLVERLGLKTVLIGSMMVEGAGLGSFLFVDSLWSYYFVGFLIGLGQAAVIISLKLLVSRWFVRNVGLAGAIAIIGGSFAGVLFPLVAVQLIPVYGWRMAFACLSLGIFFVSIPVAMFTRCNPSEEDILPEAVKETQALTADDLRAAEPDVTFRTILRERSFWLIAVAAVLSASVDQALLQHSIFYLTHEVGLTRTMAAAAWSATFFTGICAKGIAGMTFDRLSLKGVAAWNLLLGVAILLALPVHGFFTAILFTSVLGFAHGGLVVDSPVIAKHVYGPRHMHRLLPMMTGFNTIGAAVGPLLLAAIYDRTGSSVTGLTLFIGFATIAALLMWRVKPVYRDRIRQIAAPQDVPRRHGEAVSEQAEIVPPDPRAMGAAAIGLATPPTITS